MKETRPRFCSLATCCPALAVFNSNCHYKTNRNVGLAIDSHACSAVGWTHC